MFSLLSQSCEFVKKRDDTVLRVVWSGGLQLIDTGPKRVSAGRWFFTINGQEPRTTDTQLYVGAKGADMHIPTYGGRAYRVLIHTNYICFIYHIQNTILLFLLVAVVVVMAVAAVAAAVVVGSGAGCSRTR